MNFDTFLSIVPKIFTAELFGTLAHEKMAPAERMEEMKNLDINDLNPKKAAVMMLVYPKNKLAYLALIIRNTYPGIHSSQIAFPGGKVEFYDKTLEQTALRETHEEIGIAESQINVIRSFTAIYIPPSNFMVHPFLGFSSKELVFDPDPSEVAGIIEYSIDDFLDDNNIVQNKITTSYIKDIDVPAFKIDQHMVWGATAMMLSELKEVIKKVI